MTGGSMLMDGSPADGAQLQSARELTVYGHDIGSAAVLEVTTEDVRGSAGELRALAARVRSAIGSVRVAAYAIGPTEHLTTVGSLASQRCREVAADGERHAGELDELAGRLEAAADSYEAAEAASAAHVWQLPHPPEIVRTLLPLDYLAIASGLAAADAVLHGQAPWAFTRHGAGMVVDAAVWTLTGRRDGVLSTSRDLGTVVTALGVSNQASVERVAGPGSPSGGPPPSAAPVEGVAGVAAAVADLYPEEGNVPPGTIRIDRVTAVDGSTSWLVLVPGTQGELVSTNPFDWVANPGAMAGQVTAATSTVVQAMRQAGIKPGQRVMLAGHSQGGLVAYNAANQVGDLDVTGVVALGSPTGHLEAPAGTEVLSVQHVEDPVPGLDNAADPVSENVTVVERQLTASISPDAAAASDWQASHGTDLYVQTGELIDASTDGAIEDFLDTNAAVIDGSGVSESFYYQGTREP